MWSFHMKYGTRCKTKNSAKPMSQLDYISLWLRKRIPRKRMTIMDVWISLMTWKKMKKAEVIQTVLFCLNVTCKCVIFQICIWFFVSSSVQLYFINLDMINNKYFRRIEVYCCSTFRSYSATDWPIVKLLHVLQVFFQIHQWVLKLAIFTIKLF